MQEREPAPGASSGPSPRAPPAAQPVPPRRWARSCRRQLLTRPGPRRLTIRAEAGLSPAPNCPQRRTGDRWSGLPFPEGMFAFAVSLHSLRGAQRAGLPRPQLRPSLGSRQRFLRLERGTVRFLHGALPLAGACVRRHRAKPTAPMKVGRSAMSEHTGGGPVARFRGRTPGSRPARGAGATAPAKR